MNTRAVCIGVFAALMAPAVTSPAAASADPEDWDYSVSTTTLLTPEAGLDTGGETRLTSYHLRAGAERQIGASSEAGVRISYDHADRVFSGVDGFGELQHLSNTNRLGIAGSISSNTHFGVSYGVRPFVSWSFESGAFSEDAMSYGAALAALAGLSKGTRLGAGVRLSRDMDDATKASPIIIVHWELNENWTIANPREANFTSPAGLEIRYRSGEDWWLALAGMHHSNDYRLDKGGVASKGIGESSGILTYVRATHRWTSAFRINGYIGAVFDGELEVEDVDGNEVASGQYDTVPFVALSIEGSF